MSHHRHMDTYACEEEEEATRRPPSSVAAAGAAQKTDTTQDNTTYCVASDHRLFSAHFPTVSKSPLRSPDKQGVTINIDSVTIHPGPTSLIVCSKCTRTRIGRGSDEPHGDQPLFSENALNHNLSSIHSLAMYVAVVYYSIQGRERAFAML